MARNVDDLDMPVIYHAFDPVGNGAFRSGGGKGGSSFWRVRTSENRGFPGFVSWYLGVNGIMYAPQHPD